MRMRPVRGFEQYILLKGFRNIHLIECLIGGFLFDIEVIGNRMTNQFLPWKLCYIFKRITT